MRTIQLVKTMGMAVALALPAVAQGQIWKQVPVIRDPNGTTRNGGVYDGRDGRNSQGIPPGQMPPAGMCRIWIDGVPPGRQPAPTDCATAERNRPANARVIYGDRTNGRYEDRGNGTWYPTSGRTNDGWYRDQSGRYYRLERDRNGRVYRVYRDGRRVYEGNGSVYRPNDGRRDRDDDDRYDRVNGRYGTYGAGREYDARAAKRAEKEREKARREWEKSQRKHGKGHDHD